LPLYSRADRLALGAEVGDGPAMLVIAPEERVREHLAELASERCQF
jgi:hypothetical protein